MYGPDRERTLAMNPEAYMAVATYAPSTSTRPLQSTPIIQKRTLIYEGPASMNEPRGFDWLKAHGLIVGLERDEHVRIYQLG
jgi:hypothetical protein